MMLLHILGTAAGGGFPQWNCHCPGCCRVREGRAIALTQSSIAIRSNSSPWFLVNASPDIRQQLEQLHAKHPEQPNGRLPGLRSSPIAAILLTDAEIDHTSGLVLLREAAEPLRIYGTEQVRQALTKGYPLLPTLQHYCGVEWSVLEPGQPVKLVDEASSGLAVEAFSLSTKPPRYMQDQVKSTGTWGIGLTFRDRCTGSVLTYAPGLATLDEEVRSRFAASNCILVDGTFWRNDELSRLGITNRTAQAMGHLPLSGDGGSLQQLSKLPCSRKILVHINNTNPILLHNSPEWRSTKASGIEVGYDGLTIEL